MAGKNSNYHTNRANKYARDVVNGKIPACLYIIQACKRHLDDLENSKKSRYPYVYDPVKGERMCNFMEKMPHVKGKWVGTTIKLEPWQSFSYTCLFGWVRKKDGLRRFREFYGEIPRKNTKSTMGSGIGNYMFTADGEPAAEVFSGATSLDQAMEVFRPAWKMSKKTPAYLRKFGIELGGTDKNPGPMYSVETDSRFEPVVGKPGDGASPHCAIVDEYHEHDNDHMFDCFATGMGAREQPLLAVITTAGTNTEGPCYNKRLQAIKMLSGKEDNPELFAVIYTIDEKETKLYLDHISGLKKIKEVCTCNAVPTTLIERLCRKVFASHATVDYGESRTPSAEPSKRSLPTSGKKKGTGRTPKSAGSIKYMQTDGMRSTLEGGGKFRTDGTSETRKVERTQGVNGSMGSPQTSTESCQNNTAECVEYADVNTRFSALTIATLQDALEECFADGATRLSVSLEIAQRVLAEHSDTCKARRNTTLNPDGVIYTTPPDDWTDFEVWKKANPNYEVSVFHDFLFRQYQEALRDARKQNILKCKHLNIWNNAAEAFFNMVEYERCSDSMITLNDFYGEQLFLGLDLASKIDLVALMLLFRKGKDYYLFSKYFLPEARIHGEDMAHYAGWVHEGYIETFPGERIDFEAVQAEVEQLAKQFDLSGHKRGGGEVCNDPWNAQQMVSNLEKKRIAITEIPQTAQMLSEPMKEIEAVIKDGRLHHDGNPVTYWCFSNTMVTRDKKDNVFPFKLKDKNKIDGLVATVNAMCRAMVGNDKKPLVMPQSV